MWVQVQRGWQLSWSLMSRVHCDPPALPGAALGLSCPPRFSMMTSPPLARGRRCVWAVTAVPSHRARERGDPVPTLAGL